MIAADPIPPDAAALGDAKAYLRIDGDGEDAALTTLIAAAIGHCEAFTGQVLLARTMRETAPAASSWCRLGRTPVTTVVDVATAPAAGSGTTLPIDAYALDIDAAGDGWIRVRAPVGACRIAVRYTAGIADGWAGLPEPLRQGVIRLASHLYAHRDEADEGPPPAAVAALWRPWRRMRLA